MMLLALVLAMLGTSDVMAQKIYRTKLDKSFFKAWTSNEPGATIVADPEPIDVTDENPNGNKFTCENNLYKVVGSWSCFYGNSNCYYLWYADLTGTKTMYFTGTPGFKFYVQFNRQAPEDGGDPHGGSMVQQELTIGANGTVSYDCSAMEYVHLNCIKTKQIEGTGVVKSIEIEGTVVPVVGIKSMINNGDAEGDDLESFPVSYDGPNNGDTANERPEIVAGEGVDGSKCFKVTSFDAPTQTWHTQFYIKADEVMPKGTKWKLKMFVKADEPAVIQTSSQGQPRAWKGGFIDPFEVGTEWKEISRSGEISADDVQSFAFDLSTGAKTEDGYALATGSNNFYFDNIQFGIDLGGDNPVEGFQAFYETEVVRIDMGSFTNIKDLVKAAPGGQFLLFPDGAFQLKEDGTDVKILSAEARPDGQIYLFLKENLDDDSEVEVIFNNPADASCHLKFVGGEYEGQDVPSFVGVIASFLEGAGNGNFSSNLAVPTVIACDPEIGSFNLPVDTKTFKVTFDNLVKVADLVAKLGNETLTKTPAEGSAKEITLTRTGSGDLKGAYELTLSNIKPVVTISGAEPGSAVIKLSFGPVVLDGEQVAVLYESDFTNGDGENAQGAGWKVNADQVEGEDQPLQPANSSAGCRLQHGKNNGFAADVLYLASRSTSTGGVAIYGLEDDYLLTLQPKTYHLTLNSAQWDAYENARKLKVQVLAQDAVDPTYGTLVDGAQPLAEEVKDIEGEINNNKQYTAFDIPFTVTEAGAYVIRLVPSNKDGNPAGYSDGNAIANVKVTFIPDVMGIIETQALEKALEEAKKALADNSGERYSGEDYNALDALIKDVDANKANYSAPSVYTAKTEALGAAVKALADHVAACDSYDSAIKETVDLVAKFKDTKFAPTEYYQGVVKIAEKYHATTELKITLNEETQENDTTVVYKFDIVKEKDALTTATKEVSDANLLASKWLTEGESGKGWGWITTGYAALHERIRRGVALLESLGVAKDDALIVRANAELGDNDEIADEIVARAQEIILTDLAKGAESKLFEAPFDEELEEYGDTPSYDLSVFFKNPNCYGPANSTEVPGWTSVQGNCFAWSSWDGAQNHSASTPYPEDCDIHAGWHPNPYAMVEQTVTNLPAGVYVVSVKCNDNGASWDGGTCAFIRTSDCDPIEEGVAVDRDTDFTLYVTASGELTDENGDGITITDGQLGVGFYYNNESQAFFEEITAVKMVAPADGYDYAAALTSIKNAPATAKVRAIQVYDLNGRRMIRAQKGLQIVKKQMSDGTVRVEKLIVK